MGVILGNTAEVSWNMGGSGCTSIAVDNWGAQYVDNTGNWGNWGDYKHNKFSYPAPAVPWTNGPTDPTTEKSKDEIIWDLETERATYAREALEQKEAMLSQEEDIAKLKKKLKQSNTWGVECVDLIGELHRSILELEEKQNKSWIKKLFG